MTRFQLVQARLVRQDPKRGLINQGARIPLDCSKKNGISSAHPAYASAEWVESVCEEIAVIDCATAWLYNNDITVQ